MEVIARYNYQKGKSNKWISFNTENPLDSYIKHRDYINTSNNIERTISNLNGILGEQLANIIKAEL